MNEYLHSVAIAWAVPVIGITIIAGLTELAEWVFKSHKH